MQWTQFDWQPLRVARHSSRNRRWLDFFHLAACDVETTQKVHNEIACVSKIICQEKLVNLFDNKKRFPLCNRVFLLLFDPVSWCSWFSSWRGSASVRDAWTSRSYLACSWEIYTGCSTQHENTWSSAEPQLNPKLPGDFLVKARMENQINRFWAGEKWWILLQLELIETVTSKINYTRALDCTVADWM